MERNRSDRRLWFGMQLPQFNNARKIKKKKKRFTLIEQIRQHQQSAHLVFQEQHEIGLIAISVCLLFRRYKMCADLVRSRFCSTQLGVSTKYDFIFFLSSFFFYDSKTHIGVEEREKERERGSNLRRQHLASPTAQVLVAHTTRPVQKNRLRDEL